MSPFIVDDGCPSSKTAYDNLDRLQSVTGAIDYLGRSAVTSYQYDAASNLTQRTDARNLVTKYFPDPANQLDYMEHWNGTTLVDLIDYIYDAVGNRTQMSDPSGTTRYAYDALNRPNCVGPNIISGPCPSGNVAYQYDDLPGGSAADYPGQRTKITYPDGKYVDYAHLADGRMSTVTDWLAKQTSYTYDDAGRLTKTQYPNTVWADYTYDAADRLTSAANKKTGPVTISTYTYALDSVGNRTQMVELSGTHSYQYDVLYRLTQATYPGPQTDAYQYDANGNRTFKNATSYTYDAADQMTATGGVSYGYDNNGNQTGRGSDTFSYDHENRLTQTVISGATSSSIYNADGLRMSHTVGAQTTNYTWDIAAGLPVVFQDGTNTYIYGLDLISATDGGGAQTFFLYDGLGSTTGLTDGSGNSAVSYAYDAFGGIRTQTGMSGNYWLFTGEQRDLDSSLYYLRARYYDPAIGRFLSQDPLPTGNLYAYVGNDPVDFVDPMGTCRVEVRLSKVIGIGNTVAAWHAYIYTYDNLTGEEFAHRGGPSTGKKKVAWDTVAGELIPGGPTIKGEKGPWDRSFVDWDPKDKDPRVVIYEDDFSCDPWRKKFSATIHAINEARIPYDTFGPNSNSVVTEILERAGLKPAKPSRDVLGIIPNPYQTPGWGDDLLP